MSLDNERVLFYFRHRDQIEEWAGLRGEAAVAVDEWMTQLGPDVEELAQSLGTDVKVYERVGTEQTYPSFRLVRAAWGFGDTDDPPASISLQWVRARTTMYGTSTPYVGLQAPKSHAIGMTLRSLDALKQARIARKDASSLWWAAYVYVPPPANFPASLDDYREVLIEALRAAWHVYAPFVPNPAP
jgi:hypothetical protein